MNYNEAWNFLVIEYCSGKNKPEIEIQKKWEDYFAETELFGYSKIKNDIIPHPSLIIGSNKREIPDILLCRNNEKLFIAELKQYTIPKSKDIEKQLLSYLTHIDIHLSIGILVCENLYIYCYDFQQNKSVFLEIPFEENNSNGIKFMELFNKQNFDEKKIQDFVLANHLSAQHISEIKETISSELIMDLLKKHFLEKFSEEEIEKALETKSVIVTEKSVTACPVGNHIRNGKEKTKKKKVLYSIDGTESSGHCRTVYSTVAKYVEQHQGIDFDQLQKAFPDQAATPGFGKMIRKWEDVRINEWEHRSFDSTAIVLSNGQKVAISTQWTPANMQSFIENAGRIGIKIKIIG